MSKTPISIILTTLLVAAFSFQPLYAQTDPAAPSPEPSKIAGSPSEVEETLLTVHKGVHFGSPLRLSGALTFLWDTQRRGHPDEKGPSLRIELGMSGGKIALGVTDYSPFYVTALSGRLALLRTFSGPVTPFAAQRDRTYVGPEFAYTAFRLTVSVGAYRAVDSLDQGQWLIGWTIGVGL